LTGLSCRAKNFSGFTQNSADYALLSKRVIELEEEKSERCAKEKRTKIYELRHQRLGQKREMRFQTEFVLYNEQDHALGHRNTFHLFDETPKQEIQSALLILFILSQACACACQNKSFKKSFATLRLNV
jgi:hypothetical protein